MLFEILVENGVRTKQGWYTAYVLTYSKSVSTEIKN